MSSDGDFKNKPLKIYEPMNLIVFLSLYSPVILSIVVLSTSFIDKNWNGIIFICFLLGATFLRTFFYTIYDRQIHNAEDPVCNSVNYSVYGNSSFSVFVFTFFIVYKVLSRQGSRKLRMINFPPEIWQLLKKNF